MINNGQIKDIIKSYEQRGYTIKMRDIAYAILCSNIQDEKIPYYVIYGQDSTATEIETYRDRAEIKMLLKDFQIDDAGITIDESRRMVEKDIKFIEKLLKEKGDKLEPNEISNLMGKKADLTVKLFDKLGNNEQEQEQMIIVENNYNHICEHLHKECLFYTKEYAMKHWNLIEKHEKEKDKVW